MRTRLLLLALFLAGPSFALGPAAAGDLQWGTRSHGGSSPSHQSSSGSSGHSAGASPGHGSSHHDWHGGTHHDRHEGSHWSPKEGRHSGRHHGTHGGTHHDRHDRSHDFEHGSDFRFRSRAHGFSFGLHGHESGSSFGAAGPPPWGAAGPPPFAAGRGPVVFISAPFFCHLHGLGFTDESEFVRHLHEEHGLPEHRALASCREVGGKLFFFGF